MSTPSARHARSVDEADVESDDPPGAVLWLRARPRPYGPMSRTEEATPVPVVGSAAARRYAGRRRPRLKVANSLERGFRDSLAVRRRDRRRRSRRLGGRPGLGPDAAPGSAARRRRPGARRQRGRARALRPRRHAAPGSAPNAREQLRPYESVTVRMAEVEEARPTPSGFRVTAGGTASEAGVLLLATGMRYELPRIEGVEELWGRGVYHSPTATAGRCGMSRSPRTGRARHISRPYHLAQRRHRAAHRRELRNRPRRGRASAPDGRRGPRRPVAGSRQRTASWCASSSPTARPTIAPPSSCPASRRAASGSARMRARRVRRGGHRRGGSYYRSRGVRRRRRDDRQEGGRARGRGRVRAAYSINVARTSPDRDPDNPCRQAIIGTRGPCSSAGIEQLPSKHRTRN